jgi:hypothetical protein
MSVSELHDQAPGVVHRPGSLAIGVARVATGELVVALIVDERYAIELPLDGLDGLVEAIAVSRRDLVELLD